MVGTIVRIIDSGSVVGVFIKTKRGRLIVVAADGNLWRRAEASLGTLSSESLSLIGTQVEFQANDWGGLEWFMPVLEPSSDNS